MNDLYGGVETGGSWCVCALGRAPEEIVAEEQFPTTDPRTTLGRIVDFFHRNRGAVAIGIGSFGPVDLDPSSPTWGYVTSTPKPGWQNVSVARMLQEQLGVAVAFDTDVAAAAVGEHRWGAGQGVATVCYLTVGTGIGAGLLYDGQPWHGLVHPEVGHLWVPRDRERDDFKGSCPVHGDCWEGLASGLAIAERWGLAAGQLPDDHPAWALEADYLALGIVSIVMVASPQRVIVGGGVMERRSLLPMIRSRVRRLIAGYLEAPLLDEQIDAYLVASRLGDRAGVLGAIAMAREVI